MKYCSECGHTVAKQIPEHDNRERFVCTRCGTIHYQNPRIIAGCLPVFAGQILLCRRNIEPRKGYWTLPAGFMEEGETLQQGAERETLEEAGIHVTAGSLLSMISVPHISQVHIFFLAQMHNPEHAQNTTESTEIKLFAPHDIPWDEIAFPTVSRTLRDYLADVNAGNLTYRVSDIQPRERLQPKN
jgi:ADP-ribose pyrophosphatase YjhB (NUDIX family)